MAVMLISSGAGSSSGGVVGDFDLVESAMPEPSGACGDYIQCALAGVPGLLCTKWGQRVTSTGMAISAPVGL